MNTVIHVVNRKTRYSFDGQTGVCVLAGTRGQVSAMTINTTGHRLPTLTIYWDAVIVQDRENNEPSIYKDWEESGISPREVKYLRAASDPDEAAAP
jgi:hypothetical protein